MRKYNKCLIRVIEEKKNEVEEIYEEITVVNEYWKILIYINKKFKNF